MKASPILALILITLLVLVVIVLDQSISGGSASDPTYGLIYIGVCIVAIFVIAIKPRSAFLMVTGWSLAALPIVFVIATFAYTQYRWDTRPEKTARKLIAENIRCIVSDLQIAKEDKMFVSARINMIAEWGDIKTEDSEKGKTLMEIEDRLNIYIYPDCTYAERR